MWTTIRLALPLMTVLYFGCAKNALPAKTAVSADSPPAPVAQAKAVPKPPLATAEAAPGISVEIPQEGVWYREIERASDGLTPVGLTIQRADGRAMMVIKPFKVEAGNMDLKAGVAGLVTMLKNRIPTIKLTDDGKPAAGGLGLCHRIAFEFGGRVPGGGKACLLKNPSRPA